MTFHLHELLLFILNQAFFVHRSFRAEKRIQCPTLKAMSDFLDLLFI